MFKKSSVDFIDRVSPGLLLPYRVKNLRVVCQVDSLLLGIVHYL